MFYKLYDDAFFRKWKDVGYITSTGHFSDRIVDKVGAEFLGTLTRKPKSIDDIADELSEIFRDVNKHVLKEDAISFFSEFVEDGFIVGNESYEEAEKTKASFTYDADQPATLTTDFTPEIKRADKNSTWMLIDYLMNNPILTNLQIELTSTCNERCLHCYIPHEYKTEFISKDLYYSVLEQLTALGTWHVTLSGGEPMLHPDFLEFVKAAKQNDFFVTVLSNLTLLDDEMIEVFKTGAPCSVQVSLYSMNPERHDLITQQPGSFYKTKNAVLKLISNDIPVQISCPTIKQNKDDYSDVLKWANKHKIRAITNYSIMAEYNGDISNLQHRLSPEETKKVISDIIELDQLYQKEILSDEFADKIKTYGQDPDEIICGVGLSTCCLVSNGNVFPCAGWQGYSCGNLHDDSLKHIWENSEELNYLRSVKRKDFKECLGCDKSAFCSPCMVRNANESPTGDPFEIPKGFCEVSKINKDIVFAWREEHLKEQSTC